MPWNALILINCQFKIALIIIIEYIGNIIKGALSRSFQYVRYLCLLRQSDNIRIIKYNVIQYVNHTMYRSTSELIADVVNKKIITLFKYSGKKLYAKLSSKMVWHFSGKRDMIYPLTYQFVQGTWMFINITTGCFLNYIKVISVNLAFEPSFMKILYRIREIWTRHKTQTFHR